LGRITGEALIYAGTDGLGNYIQIARGTAASVEVATKANQVRELIEVTPTLQTAVAEASKRLEPVIDVFSSEERMQMLLNLESKTQC